MEHPDNVLGEALIAHDDPPKVLQPGKSRSTFDRRRSAAVGDRVASAVSGSSGEAQSVPRHGALSFGIQSVRLVGVVADETRGELADKSLRECGENLGTLTSVGRQRVDG